MEITKSTTKITVDGKSYGSIEEMDAESRRAYDQAMGQLSKISETSQEKVTNLTTSVGSGVAESKGGNGMLIFILGMLAGAAMMYFLK